MLVTVRVVLRLWNALLRRLARLNPLLDIIRNTKRFLSLLLTTIGRHLFGPKASCSSSRQKPDQPPIIDVVTSPSLRPGLPYKTGNSSVLQVTSVVASSEPTPLRSHGSASHLEEGLSEQVGTPSSQPDDGNPNDSSTKKGLNTESSPTNDTKSRDDHRPVQPVSDAPPNDSLPMKRFVPIRPLDMSRWHDAWPKVPLATEVPSSVFPLEIETIPSDWERHVHPGGWVYYHTERQGRIFFTNINITGANRWEVVYSFIDEMETLLSNRNDVPSENIHIYLEPKQKDGIWLCKYYMVNDAPNCRWVFWLDTYDLTQLYYLDLRISTTSDIKNFIDSEYWRHCSFYPHCMNVTQEFLNELSGVNMYYLTESMLTPNRTLAPFHRSDLSELKGMIEQMKVLVKSEDARPYAIQALGDIMFRIVDARRCYYYGQHHAIEEQKTSLVPARTLLIKIFSPPLFSAPDRYLRQLLLVDPDEFWRKNKWPQFIASLEKPWSDFILYATVLLAVNLSYLAVDNVVLAGQIASLCSTILSIGCIVVGLLLVSEDHTDPKGTGDNSTTYFHDLKSDRFGYEPVAILYALPYALLMWSMITFVVAIAYFCFQDNDIERGIVAFPASIVFLLIAWEINIHWKSSSGEKGTLWQRIRWRLSDITDYFFYTLGKREDAS